MQLSGITNYFAKKRVLIKILIIISIAIPFIIVVTNVLLGNIDLWYDNARDLLSGWDNLTKLTLIGPTSGIPGIFYGPYWIWLLSFGLLISKDPRSVILITATLPYFLIFAFLWFRLSKFFGWTTVTIGWILFMFSTGMTYAGQLWNPYPAPLITLAAIYILLTEDYTLLSRITIVRTVLLGFFLGLLINFHISFGIGFSLGVLLFLLLTAVIEITNRKKTATMLFRRFILLCIAGIGVGIAFIPFFLFEIRHGFHQIAVITHTLGKYGDVVGVKGLTKIQIYQQFLITFSKLLHVPIPLTILIFVVSLLWIGLLIKKKKLSLTKIDIKVLALLISLFAGISFIYFTARNPVWSYHFIGVDVLFLLLITFLLSKLFYIRGLFVIGVVCIMVLNVSLFVTAMIQQRPSAITNDQKLVKIISVDAGNAEYTVSAYSPSIYMYEYSYLFRWLAQKDVPFDPSQNATNSRILYLIVPFHKDDKVLDFIHFRSPDTRYKTEKIWTTADGKQIFKRTYFD